MVSKILIIGATGMTGLCVLDAAMKKDLHVRVLVRDSDKLPLENKHKLEIIVGDVLKQSDVDQVVEGVDAVVVALGTRNDLKPTTDLSEGMKNIINAMKANNVRIVSVCLSAFLFYEPDKVPKMFVDLNADHQRMFDALKESELDYIAVFPPHIADSPSGNYITEFDKSPGRAVSKWDLGKFLIECLSFENFYQRVVGISTVS